MELPFTGSPVLKAKTHNKSKLTRPQKVEFLPKRDLSDVNAVYEMTQPRICSKVQSNEKLVS